MSYEDALRQQFSTNLHVDYRPTIDSTNDAMWRLFDSGESIHQRVMIVDQQSKGRGRRNRDWITPAGSAVLMTVGLVTDSQHLKGLPVTIPVVVRAVLQEFSEEALFIKWPNDIWRGDKKLAGILMDTRVSGSSVTLLVGTGINVGAPETTEGVGLLQSKDQKSIDAIRAKLAARLANAIIEVMSKNNDLNATADLYNAHLLWNNQLVRERDGDILGTCRGINSFGELLIERNGMLTPFNESEMRITVVV